MHVRITRRASLLALLAAVGCGSDLAAGGPRTCHTNSDCGAGAYCRIDTCVRDGNPPNVVLTSPAQDAVINSPSIVVAGGADDPDGSGIQRVEYSLDGTTFHPVDLDADRRAFRFEVATPEVDYFPMPLTVQAIDNAGNARAARVTVFADRLGPRVTFAALPAPQAAKDVGHTITFAGRATDGSGVARVDLSFDGVAWDTASSADFSRELAVPAGYEGPALALRVRAIDNQGNTAEAVSPGLHVDTLAPRLRLTAPAEGSWHGEASLQLAGEVVDAELGALTWRLDDGAEQELTAADGAFEVTIPLSAKDDGVSHTLTVVARDRAGNETMLERHYVVDRVPPQIAIVSPALDGNCDANGCTGAIVNLATASYLIRGTVRDGGGLSAEGALSAMIGIADATISLQGSEWRFDWSALPDDPGNRHRFQIIAKDKVGNTAVAERVLYVDRVAPTLTKLVDGKRLVSRTASLVTFSEAMDPRSVPGAVQLNLSAAGADFRSTDNRTYGFGSAQSLLPYTIYKLTVNRLAKDQAGNPLASAVDQSFLTEATPPPTTAFTVSNTGSAPALAVDFDGNPIVAFWDSAQRALQVARWDGRSQMVTTSVQVPDVLLDGQAVELEQTSSVAADLSLSVQQRGLFVGVVSGGGRRVYFSENVGNGWHGRTGDKADVVAGSTDANTAPSFGGPSSYCNHRTPLGLCDWWIVDREPLIRYYDASVGNVLERRLTATTLGNASVRYNAPMPLRSVRGAALATNSAIFLPTAANTGYLLDATHGTNFIAGVDRIQYVPLVPGELVQRKSAWLAWSQNATLGIPVPIYTYSTISLACSADPAAANTWRKSGERTASSNNSTAVSVRVASTESTVAVALETTKPEVNVATFPNTDCTAALDVSGWTWTTLAGKQPALAFDNQSRLWKAWVSSPGGQLVLAAP